MNKKSLFIDIETTGLSPVTSALTMIGVKNSSGTVKQWLNETGRQQKEILSDFLTFATPYERLITFNGNTFDLPFLSKKCQEYHLSDSIQTKETMDLYQILKKWNHIYQWKNLKQKTLETYLGIHRRNRLSGKQMIKVYQDYLDTKDTSLKSQLLLHNKEDLDGLEGTMSLLYFQHLIDGAFVIQHAKLLKNTISISMTPVTTCPISIQVEKGPFQLSCKKDSCTLMCHMTNNQLPHYYAAIKDYCYIEKEQILLPKSMASTIPQSQRKRPTYDQCFTLFQPTQNFCEHKKQVYQFCLDSLLYLLRKDTKNETLITT